MASIVDSLLSAGKENKSTLESMQKTLTQMHAQDKTQAKAEKLAAAKALQSSKRLAADKAKEKNGDSEIISLLTEIRDSLNDKKEGGKGGGGGGLGTLGMLGLTAASIGIPALKAAVAGVTGALTKIVAPIGTAGALLGGLGRGISEGQDAFGDQRGTAVIGEGEEARKFNRSDLGNKLTTMRSTLSRGTFGGEDLSDKEKEMLEKNIKLLEDLSNRIGMTKSVNDQLYSKKQELEKTEKGTEKFDKLTKQIEELNTNLTQSKVKQNNLIKQSNLDPELARRDTLKPRSMIADMPLIGNLISQKDRDEIAALRASGKWTPSKDDIVQGRQRGGPITVPGSGSGDKVPMMLKPGSFVLNRNASKFIKRQEGGPVPTLLEPGEKVFAPGSYGPEIQQLNSAVPRFQSGGNLGGDIYSAAESFFSSLFGGGDKKDSDKDSPGAQNSSIGSISGDTSQKGKEITKSLMSDVPGITKQAAAGIAGNMAHESAGFNPGIREGGPFGKDSKPWPKGTVGKGYGWAQWTNASPGDRYDKFIQSYGANYEKIPTNKDNYKFLLKELRQGNGGFIPGSMDEYKKMDNTEEATVYFRKNWERAGVHHDGPRIKYANDFLKLQEGGEVKQHPDLVKMNDKNIKKASADPGKCVTGSLETMQKSGVANPPATGTDKGNNPRGGAVQLIKSYGWSSLPGGSPITLDSPYGKANANVMSAGQWDSAVSEGKIPSGAIIFQTRHSDWNATSPSSSGYDMAIAQDSGRSLWNGQPHGSHVYGNLKKVIALTPGGEGSGTPGKADTGGLKKSADTPGEDKDSDDKDGGILGFLGNMAGGFMDKLKSMIPGFGAILSGISKGFGAGVGSILGGSASAAQIHDDDKPFNLPSVDNKIKDLDKDKLFSIPNDTDYPSVGKAIALLSPEKPNTPLSSPPSDAVNNPSGNASQNTNKNISEVERKALDVIGKYESDPVGGYNAVNQYGGDGGHSTGSEMGMYSGDIRNMKQHKGKALTDMTIGEIRSLQAKSSMSNAQWRDEGRLHAVGRYQFIGPTFAATADALGMSEDTKFTPEIQDKFGLHLLKNSHNGIAQWVGPNTNAEPHEKAIVAQARKMQNGGVVGLKSGGMVPTMLEPGEQVFAPGQWDSTISGMNSAIPRFQSGGQVGKTYNSRNHNMVKSVEQKQMEMDNEKQQPIVVPVPMPQNNNANDGVTGNAAPPMPSGPSVNFLSDVINRTNMGSVFS